MQEPDYTMAGPYPGTPHPRDGERRSRVLRWLALSLLFDVLLVAGVALWTHNTVVSRAEAVDAAWAQVESSFQRRADLVPRLVATVKRYVRHESELLQAVTRERGAALAAASAGGAPDAARLEALARSGAALDRDVRAVLAVAEDYPELRSSDQFLALQAQLEGTENRIHVARMAFNDAVRAYNAALVKLPTSLVAQARGLERRAYFESDPGARVAEALDLE